MCFCVCLCSFVCVPKNACMHEFVHVYLCVYGCMHVCINPIATTSVKSKFIISKWKICDRKLINGFC